MKEVAATFVLRFVANNELIWSAQRAITPTLISFDPNLDNDFCPKNTTIKISPETFTAGQFSSIFMQL